MGKEIRSVLLMRVVAHAELHNTREAPDRVRQAFPEARLMGLGAADCPDTALLGADPRLDDLLLLPANIARSARAFRGFMARQPCDATVMCYGATSGVNYPKQILASLLCPGRNFFLDAAGRLFPALSVLGLRVILRAALSILLLFLLRAGARLVVATLRLLARLTPVPKDDAGLPAPDAVRRLLFIRLDHIGDVAMSLPALHALRQHYPDARIDVLVLPEVAPLLAEVPDVDEVIPYAAPVFTRNPRRQAGLGRTLALVHRLRRGRYDVAVELRGNDLCRLLAFLAGARRRLGPGRSLYEMSGRTNFDFLLTHPVAPPDDSQYAVDRSLQTLRACGLPLPDAPYRLPVKPEREAPVRETLAGLGVRRGYAVIHARPSEESRQWHPERFAAVADHLTQVHGLDVLLTGAPRDRDYNADILARVARPERVFNAAGLFALPELPALLADAALMVSVDTGPMHVAALVGTPLVTLFHPTLAPLHHPYGQEDGVLIPPAESASEHRIWEGGVLAAIPADDVIAAVDRKQRRAAKTRLCLVSGGAAEEWLKAA